ncbi:MAG TPA: YraN family protein [Flavobacteriales bacterium]
MSKHHAPHLRTGAAGEDLACRWLEARGFQVLHRNWRHGRDELDIVAREGRFLVVVEVKTRTSDRWGDPEASVDPAKQRKLMRCAEEYLFNIPDDLELRFDVIGITHTPTGPQVLHIPNAFYPTIDEQTS